MPLFSGIATHDDTKHVGSAKRGEKNGIAGLDHTGDVLSPGNCIRLLDTSTSQYGIKLREDDHFALLLDRKGENDNEGYIRESNVLQRIQTESMKNVPFGIAGLDSLGRIDTKNAPFILEEYSNHTGTLDNFTIVNTEGSGSVSEDSLTHSIKISSGDTSHSRGGIELGDSLPVDKNVNVFQCKVRDYNTIPNNYNRVQLGFSSDPDNRIASNTIVFRYVTAGSWEIYFRDKNARVISVPVSVAKGDILTVELYNNSAVLFINGDQVYATASNAFEGTMTPCIMAYAPFSEPPTAVNMYVDAISLKIYKG